MPGSADHIHLLRQDDGPLQCVETEATVDLRR